MPAESALAILVPAAEPVVGKIRAQFDPAAAAGVPAHITILYPFLPPDEIDGQVEAELAAIFFAQPAFSFSLINTQTFPGVLYLAPEPEASFRQLIETVAGRFPDYPPYGGLHQEIIPHLTVGHTGDPEAITRLRSDFEIYAAGRLPIRAEATAVTLIEMRTDRWQVRREFSLGA